jgi:hypothetical protein
MKYLYIFQSDGSCKSISSFDSQEQAEKYVADLAIDLYYISDNNTIKVTKARLENGVLVENQLQESNEVLAQKATTQRFFLLQESDWTDTVSAQIRLGSKYQEWQNYRQLLRDITKQPGYPINIIWPTPPQG